MIEIRFHGRGGQGAVTAAELLALAYIDEGHYAQAFPAFGPEKRGAPVAAFVRMSDERIRMRCQIMEPDVIVVLDPKLVSLPEVWQGLKEDGTAVINTTRNAGEMRDEISKGGRMAVVDALRVAMETIGIPVVNTAMLGATVRATGSIKLQSLEEPLRHRFGKAADKNIAAVRVAYERTKVA